MNLRTYAMILCFMPIIICNSHVDRAGIQGIDVMAVKISGGDGSELWRKMDGRGWMGSAGADGYVQDSAHAIAADGKGDVVIAGNTEGALFGSMGEMIGRGPGL